MVKRWLKRQKRKLEEAQMKTVLGGRDFLLKTFDSVLEHKIQDFEKKGIPLEADRLMTGAEALVKLGLSIEEMRARVEEKIKERA